MRTEARRVVHSEMHIKVGMFLWSFLIELFPRFIGIPLILAFGSGTWEQRVQQARNRDMYPYFGKENPVFVNDLFTGFGPGALWVSIVLYVALREHVPYDATLEMINIFIFSAGRAAVLATKYACYQTDYLRLDHPRGPVRRRAPRPLQALDSAVQLLLLQPDRAVASPGPGRVRSRVRVHFDCTI